MRFSIVFLSFSFIFWTAGVLLSELNYRYAGIEVVEEPLFSGGEKLRLQSFGIDISEREYPGYISICNRECLNRMAYINIDSYLARCPLLYLSPIKGKGLVGIMGEGVDFSKNWLYLDIEPSDYEPFFYPLTSIGKIVICYGGPEVASSWFSSVELMNIPVRREQPITGVFLSDGNFNTERYRFYTDFSVPHLNTSVGGERNLTSGFGRYPNTSYGSLSVSSIATSDWLEIPVDFVYSGGVVNRYSDEEFDMGYKLISVKPRFNCDGSVSPFIRFAYLSGEAVSPDALYDIGGGLRFGSGDNLTFLPTFSIRDLGGQRIYNFSSDLLLRDEGMYLISCRSDYISYNNKRIAIGLSGSFFTNSNIVPFVSCMGDLWADGNRKKDSIIGGVRLYIPDRMRLQIFMRSSNILEERKNCAGLESDIILWRGFRVRASGYKCFSDIPYISNYVVNGYFGFDREIVNEINPFAYLGISRYGSWLQSYEANKAEEPRSEPYTNISLSAGLTIGSFEVFANFDNLLNTEITDEEGSYPPEPRNYQFGINWNFLN